MNPYPVRRGYPILEVSQNYKIDDRYSEFDEPDCKDGKVTDILAAKIPAMGKSRIITGSFEQVNVDHFCEVARNKHSS